MKKYYLSALAVLTMTTSSAFAGGPDDFIGSMWPTAATYCPRGTVEANGQILLVQEYTSLFALYGNTYGGDGRNAFGVPDMRGRMPIGTGTLPDTSYTIRLGVPVGQESVNTTLPTHTHTATFTRDPMKVNIPVSLPAGGKTYTPSPTNPYLSASSGGTGADMWAGTSGTAPVALAGVTSSGGVGGGSVTVAPTGTATPTAITTIPPQLGVRFCIVTDGMFPPRPY